MNRILNKKTKRVVIFLIVLGFFLLPQFSFARENVTDWYIKDFFSEIRVNRDSSLDITEKITADCGEALEKHGIFRVLPEEIKLTNGEKISIPVELVSITDFNDQKIKYTQSKNSSDHTVTWKIGDSNKTVKGVNYYKIHYRVENAIRFTEPHFDELYWNLNGNFWDLEIDRFEANIIFPLEITKDNSAVDYYTGYLGEKGKSLANYQWIDKNTLAFYSTKTLLDRQGITASVTFPKGIFIPYQPGFWKTYGNYFFLILPLISFLVCFYFWWKYGKDPKVDKAIVPEYDAPGNLTPMELGMLKNNGRFDNKFITAEIINLATKNLITIREIENEILFFHWKDYQLTKNSIPAVEEKLNPAQKKILEKIFTEGSEIKLSSLKNKFYKSIQVIQDKAKKILEEKNLIVCFSLRLQTILVVIAIVVMFSTFFVAGFSGLGAVAWFFSGFIILLFSFIMPKRTQAGAELNWEIKGFKMFMETVDKDRAKFYEQKNIFEKFLPYAIIFGITSLWIKKMKEIYGEEFYAHYAPAWYVGNAMSFDANSFSSTIDSLSSSIAASTSSPSGSGGSGGSGGGGGGGGGGGW